MLDHGGRDHPGSWRQLTLQANQLLFQKRQGFRHADQPPVERPVERLTGQDDRHGVIGLPVAHQILFQRLNPQKRIGAAEHRSMGRQAGGQRAEVVVENQHARLQ